MPEWSRTPGPSKSDVLWPTILWKYFHLRPQDNPHELPRAVRVNLHLHHDVVQCHTEQTSLNQILCFFCEPSLMRLYSFTLVSAWLAAVSSSNVSRADLRSNTSTITGAPVLRTAGGPRAGRGLAGHLPPPLMVVVGTKPRTKHRAAGRRGRRGRPCDGWISVTCDLLTIREPQGHVVRVQKAADSDCVEDIYSSSWYLMYTDSLLFKSMEL